MQYQARLTIIFAQSRLTTISVKCKLLMISVVEYSLNLQKRNRQDQDSRHKIAEITNSDYTNCNI